ncbi:MAG: N-acyl-D-amino-acid deacylase family protein [Burkholderiales bacterium]
MHDLVIRGGTLVDGSGAPRRTADVAVDGHLISAIGEGIGRGRREIDATGALVTPGFVDIHTHYDGQVTWDPWLTPSSRHGVTTVVFGNCGVGFAPVRRGDAPYLINLMEGVEDIPGSVLSEGVSFDWESFPDYLDAVERAPKIMDVGAQLPHAALRFYVMGERGADHDSVPTPEEISRMSVLVEEALRAGALGVTTSRTIKHRAKDGRSTPSLSAREAELFGLAEGLRRAGRGVIEANSDFGPGDFEALLAAAKHGHCPLSVLLLQVNNAPELWRDTRRQIHEARAAGHTVTGQVGCRPIGVLFGFEISRHPFSTHPAWIAMESLTPAERVRRLQEDEALRRRLVDHRPDDESTRWMDAAFERTWVFDAAYDAEPVAHTSLAARARTTGTSPWALALDGMMRENGQGLLAHTFENYFHGSLDDIREMITDEATVMGLADGGAHVATICEAGATTFLLTHWARDRKRGEKLPLEFLVKKHTRDTASVYGLDDRGLLAPGLRADINVIDFDRLRAGPVKVAYDLPAGGRRLVQDATGYLHTFVAGVETLRDDRHTGALPGKLIR